MNKKNAFIATLLNLGAAAILVAVTYLVNLWILSSLLHLPLMGLFFLEGVVALIAGTVLLLGRGGISISSSKAATLSAAAGALYDRDTPSPSQIYKQDAWRARGFIRSGIVVITSGAIMVILYFLFR